MNTLHLTRQELKNLMVAPSTYIALILSLSLMGFFYFLMLLSVIAEEQEAQPPALFFSLFWIPVLLIVPMLTMRSFAEERRMGTIETLLSTPISAAQLVLAKFLGTYAFYLMVWVLSLAFPWITHQVLQQPEFAERLFERGSLYGGLGFVGLSGALFVAIGIFTSSLTRSQLVAGMLSFSVLFMLIIGVSAFNLWQLDSGRLFLPQSTWTHYFQIFEHFNDFSRGIIDTRPFAYYLTGALGVLGLTVIVIETKR